MECKQVLELITASLDGQIGVGDRSSLDTHLALCRHCKHELELERITKSVTRLHLPRVQTPPQVAARISDLLSREHTPPQRTSIPAWKNIFTAPVRKTMFAFGGTLAVIAIAILLLPANTHHSHAAPKDGNIIHQTYNNYDGIVEGSMVPQIASDDPTIIKSFFSKKANFKVSVPRLKQCTLMGAISSTYEDECVAHVIYKRGKDVIYMYETRVDSIMDGLSCSLNLPDEVKNELKKSGWYVESHVPDCTLMIWQPDSTTLCCAVAEMDKERLWACLKDANN